jgi:hypothetical protein
MSGFKVLEELWERVLTSLSAQSLVSAAVSPGEADIFISTSWIPLCLQQEKRDKDEILKEWGIETVRKCTNLLAFQHPVEV